MNLLISLLLVVWSIVALLMILVILMQRPKSEGLGAAFGGGVTENIFGAQTTNVLTKITGWLAGIFFALTFTLSILYAHRGRSESALSRELKNAPAPPPAASATALPTGSAKPSDQAVGAVPAPPAGAPVAPSATPAPQKKP
jgi:preprotein translocase subunit SecG